MRKNDANGSVTVVVAVAGLGLLLLHIPFVAIVVVVWLLMLSMNPLLHVAEQVVVMILLCALCGCFVLYGDGPYFWVPLLLLLLLLWLLWLAL
jgi:hypothetical protein